MEGFYFSITTINKTDLTKKIGEADTSTCKNIDKVRAEGYVWALWDIWPSEDINRPPYLSDFIDDKKALIEIAELLTLDNEISFDNDGEFNWLLTGLVNSPNPVISYIKKSADNVFLCIWENNLQFLCGIPPVVLKNKITEKELIEITGGWLPHGYHLSPRSNYAKIYIKRKEAYKKSIAKPASTGHATFIEFLYSPKEEWVVLECRWEWQRHRIIKETERFIYVERAPYKEGGAIKSGWQAYISRTCRVDKRALEDDCKYWHKPTCKTFTRLSYNKKLKNTKFLSESDPSDTFDDFVLELPDDEIAWAISILGIKWPETKKVIKKAFASRALIHHPDKGGSGQRFAEYKRARDLLLESLC